MTDTTEPTKPVAWAGKDLASAIISLGWATVWSSEGKDHYTAPLYDASLLSEYERVKAENAALAAHACIFLDGSGVTGDEYGNSICLVTRRSEALEAEVKRLREALEPFAKDATEIENSYTFPLPDEFAPAYSPTLGRFRAARAALEASR